MSTMTVFSLSDRFLFSLRDKLLLPRTIQFLSFKHCWDISNVLGRQRKFFVLLCFVECYRGRHPPETGPKKSTWIYWQKCKLKLINVKIKLQDKPLSFGEFNLETLSLITSSLFRWESVLEFWKSKMLKTSEHLSITLCGVMWLTKDAQVAIPLLVRTKLKCSLLLRVI